MRNEKRQNDKGKWQKMFTKLKLLRNFKSFDKTIKNLTEQMIQN